LNNTPIGGDLADYVRDATGEVVPAAANNLSAAVDAIEEAARRYSRRDFVVELRDALGERCGYQPAAAQRIDQFVTTTILGGQTLADLRRPDAPVTRAEAGEMLALGLGLSPASLATAIGQQPHGHVLMRQLDGRDHPDRLVAGIEGHDLALRVRALHPRDIYQVLSLELGDDAFRPLPAAGDRQRTYALRAGARITVVAATRGTPWEADLQDLRFAIRDQSGFSRELPGGMRARDRLGSTVWAAELPSSEDRPGLFTLSISLRHRTLGDVISTSADVRVVALA
jgi:hypothetical protein